jgi:hypothetical protein
MSQVLSEIEDKYSEWLEMAGDDSPALLAQILAKMVERERERIKTYHDYIKILENRLNIGCNR